MSGADWLFVKVFFGPTQAAADRLALEVLAPLRDEWRRDGGPTRWFFVLYSEGGSHLRLRLHQRAAHVRRALRERVEERLRRALPGLVHAPLGSAAAHEERPYPSYEYADYEPEYEKYGGARALPICERHFQHSSEAALHVLRAEREGRLGRRAAALVLAHLLAAAFVPDADERAAACAQWSAYWLRRLTPAQRRDCLDYFAERASRARPALLAQLAQARQGARGWAGLAAPFEARARRTAAALRALERRGELQAPLPAVAQACVHMLFNRLGVGVAEEAYLLHVLASVPAGSPAAPEPTLMEACR